MNICICGGGNLGHVCAGFLGDDTAHQVFILTTKPEKWSDRIVVTDNDGKQFVCKPKIITANAEEVIPLADLILLCLPGFAIRSVLNTISPWLKPSTLVGTVVSSTGFFFEALNILSNKQPLFGFQRVPFIARVCKYGESAELKGYKQSLSVALEQIENKEEVRALLEHLFKTPVRLLNSFYEVSLSNSNPLLHPARLYSMWKDWMPGRDYDKIPLFYTEWNDEASQLLIDMDAEFQNLLTKLPVEKGSIPPVLDYYESHDAQSLTKKIRSITAFKGILSPMLEIAPSHYIPDFKHRYFTEDIPFGMRFILETAKKVGCQCPVIETVYNWAVNKCQSS